MRRNKKTLIWIVLGGAAVWFWKRQRDRQMIAAAQAAMTQQQQLPTDSMAPGSVEAAANGIVKDGNGLSCMSCY